MKKQSLGWLVLLLAVMFSVGFVSCDKDDDEEDEGREGKGSLNKEHDATLYGEWVEDSDNRYVFDYYCFYSDGTGIHGSYESDIDYVNEDEDIEWYTEGKKYLYIDGAKYEYDCDGSSLEIVIKGKRRYYYEK